MGQLFQHRVSFHCVNRSGVDHTTLHLHQLKLAVNIGQGVIQSTRYILSQYHCHRSYIDSTDSSSKSRRLWLLVI